MVFSTSSRHRDTCDSHQGVWVHLTMAIRSVLIRLPIGVRIGNYLSLEAY
jgi:hypothetical protein